MKFYKTVIFPVKVAFGNYCWKTPRICKYFDLSYCSLLRTRLNRDKNGHYPKPDKCKNLKELK